MTIETKKRKWRDLLRDPSSVSPCSSEIWICKTESFEEIRVVLETLSPDEHPHFGKVIFLSQQGIKLGQETLFEWLSKSREGKYQRVF